MKKAGIATYVYLLFGTPEEDLMEARKTLDFVVSHHDQIHFLNLALFNLPMDDREGSTVETKEFYEGDLSLYVDFDHPKGMAQKTGQAISGQGIQEASCHCVDFEKDAAGLHLESRSFLS